MRRKSLHFVCHEGQTTSTIPINRLVDDNHCTKLPIHHKRSMLLVIRFQWNSCLPINASVLPQIVGSCVSKKKFGIRTMTDEPMLTNVVIQMFGMIRCHRRLPWHFIDPIEGRMAPLVQWQDRWQSSSASWIPQLSDWWNVNPARLIQYGSWHASNC